MSLPRGSRRGRTIVVSLAAMALGVTGGAGRAAGQVPVTSLGLGQPVPAVDGRAAALGGAGLGLQGTTTALLSPADAASLGETVISFTIAPEGVTVQGEGPSEDTGRSRVSLMRAIVPVGTWAFSASFSQVLDQDWSAAFSDTLDTSFGRFPFQELREHDGGVSAIDLGLARRVGPLLVGASWGRLTGTLTQSFERRFDLDLDGSGRGLAPVTDAAQLSYGGWRLRGGVGLLLGDRARVGAAAEWHSDLSATRDSVEGFADLPSERATALPASLALGGSVRLSERFLATAAAGWSQWSRAKFGVRRFGVRSTWWGGAGVEYSGLAVGGLALPLRAGGRFAELPFYPRGREALTESAVTFGVGGALADRRALFDVALEVGTRGALEESGVEESFRRFSVTFTLRQE